MSRYVPLLLVVLLLNTSWAQRVKFQNAGLVEFAPSSQTYVAALLCTGCSVLQSTPLSEAVVVRVLRQGNRAYTLAVNHTGWTPQNNLQLEARYSIKSKKGNTSVTGWLELDRSPQTLFSGSDPVTDIEAEYRLRISGQARAGTYETSVVYGAGTSAVDHRVRVVVPSALALRAVDKTGSSVVGNVSFDYSGTNALAYLRAATSGEPLDPTGSSLARVEIFTNHPKGYRVTLTVEPVIGSAGEPGVEMLHLFGTPAHAQVLSSRAPTDSFETLVLPEDFSLAVDGSEASGSYSFTVRYDAVLIP